jgi:CRP-like cAMP-binding protein
VTEGDRGGDLYVLESGKLVVERGGAVIARLVEPGALVGEMSVLTGAPNSATVRADGPAIVRVVVDAMRYISRQPDVAGHIATVLAQRLDATSAVLATLRTESGMTPAEQTRFGRIVSALFSGKAGYRSLFAGLSSS